MTVIFDNVAFNYGQRVVFNGFSATFVSGTSTAVMGASGSGKTTLLKLAAGLLKPSGGTISPEPQGAAFVFQESRLIPQLTVLQNVLFASPSSDASTLLSELGLGNELNTLPSNLSGGMARRVALARALAHRSDLLLLDEPFSGLDDITRKKTAECIRKHAAGRTIIAVTHDSAEAELLGAKILRL